jgi:hypothetical protein
MTCSIAENKNNISYNNCSNSNCSNNSKSPGSLSFKSNNKEEADDALSYEYYSTKNQKFNKKAISNAVDILARAASDKNVSYFTISLITNIES